jgi:DNA helicase-2/ATP-dependent DNA helicase PcrA
VAEDVAGLAQSGLGSIAVICKTARESWAAFDSLKSTPELRGRGIHLVKPGENRFRRSILIIPSYLAKGLEFEAVVIFDASLERYGVEADRRVLYTACTRALHRLHVHYAGPPSPFLGDVDPALYQKML